MEVKHTILGEDKMTCGPCPFTMLFLFEFPSVSSLPGGGEGEETKLTLLLLESPFWILLLVDNSLLGVEKKTWSALFLQSGLCKFLSPLGLWRGWLRWRKHLFVYSLKVLDEHSNIVEQLFRISTWSLTKLFLQ